MTTSWLRRVAGLALLATTALAASSALADGIPGARLELVEHCGHMGMIERPETYTRLLGDFLA